MTTWTVKADLDRDNTFAAADADLSAYVTTLSWRNGMTSAYQEVAPPTRAQLTLSNQEGDFRPDYVGSELITNGAFADWTSDDPDNWTVTGEAGSDPEVSEVGGGEAHGGTGTGECNLYSSDTDTVSIAQTILTSGLTYRCQLTVDLVTAGRIVVKSGTTQVSPVEYRVQGVKEFDFVADSTTFKIETVGITDITINEVSVKQTSKYGKRLKRGVLMQIGCNHGGTDYALYVGRVTNLDYQPGQFGQRAVTVVLQDAMYELLDIEFSPKMVESSLTSAALMQIFDYAVIPYPYPHTYALLGVEGYNELGVCSLYNPLEVNFDTGKTTLNYVGDASDEGKGVSAQSFITDMVRAEGGGRFWFDTRTGQYTFINRHTDPLNVTSTFTLTDADSESMQYLYGTDIMNHCEVNFLPRAVGASGSVLWTNNSTFSLKRGQQRSFTARYRDPDNESAKVGAKDFVIPKGGTDYIVNSRQDGAGADRTDQVSIFADFGANRAKLVLSNQELYDVYITHLQVRGTPLTTYEQSTVEALDGESIAANSKYSKTISMKAVDTEDFAYQYANYMLAKFKNPLSRVERVSFTSGVPNDTLFTQALALTLGDRITLTESWVNHSNDYFVVGEEHTVTVGGDNPLQSTWILKPVERELFGLLGVTGRAELNSTAVLLF